MARDPDVFSEGTLAKHQLFGLYVETWLNVFLHARPKVPTLRIVDFFCGRGMDTAGNPGSPSIILSQLAKVHADVMRWGG